MREYVSITQIVVLPERAMLPITQVFCWVERGRILGDLSLSWWVGWCLGGWVIVGG